MDCNVKEKQRNMVQKQVSPWNVLEKSILDLLLTVPREPFVLKKYQDLAYSDTFLPIGFDQVTLPPKIVGRLLQALKLAPEESVLEIGTGTGYLTTLLAKLTHQIVSIEIIHELSHQAKVNLRAFHARHVQLHVGDGIHGYMTKAPFDAIVLTGSVPVLPKALREQLSINGRLFAVVGEPPVMTAFLITRLGKDRFREQALFETEIPILFNAPSPELFNF